MNWISVKEKTPPLHEDVIVKNIFNTVAIGYLEIENTFKSNDLSFNIEVTHWIPLPELPEEEFIQFSSMRNLDEMGIRGKDIWICFKDHCKGNINDFYSRIMDKNEDMINFMRVKIKFF